MKFTVNKQKTSVEFTVTFASSDFEPARLKALARLAHDLKIPGFRNGKAPANIVEQHVNPNDLAMQTLDVMVREAIPKIYKESDVQPLSAPNVDIKKFVPGESAEVVISSDIMPEVKLCDYTKLKAPFDEPKVTDKDVEDVLKRIAESMAESKAVKRAAKLGDEVIIDFVGKKDDVAFDGGTAKDFKLKLGSGQFIPGFEDGVVGHEPGDKFDLNLKFPKDYHAENLAGAAVVFEVLLKQVNEMTVPAIDDELAKKTGAFKKLDDLKADIRQNITLQAEQRATDAYKDALLDEMIAGSKTTAPKTLVEEQAAHIREDAIRNIEAHQMKLEDYLKQAKLTEEAWKKEIDEVAEKRIIGHLIIAKLADEFGIKVKDEDVDQQLDQLRQMYGKDEHARQELAGEEARISIRNRIRINMTMDKLVELNRAHAPKPKAAPKTAKKK